MARPWLQTLALGILIGALLGSLAHAQAPEAPAAEPAPVAAAKVRIVGIELSGGIDPPGRVEAYVAHLVPAGSFFVEEGEADLEGTPISSAGRLRHGLDAIGYDAVTTAVPAGPGEVRLKIHLRAYDRVRTIFVAGNWPLRQDQIIRRISVRPGQALPLPGPDRDARLELERTRVLDYLRSQGYFDAQVRIELNAGTKVPAPVNLVVRIALGSAYPIGQVAVRGNKAIPSREIADKVRHKDWRWLWTRPMAFEQSLIREDLLALTERYRDLGYAGARLTYETSLDPAAKKVRLQLDVNERKHIDVVFEGNKRFSDDTLRDKLTIFTRGAYDDFEVDTSKEAVAQYYRERGHMLVRVDARRERVGPEADRIVFTVDEGPVLKVRAVEFTGNKIIPSRTLAEVVNVKVFPPLGAIGLGEGGYASPHQLELDIDNLVVYYRNAGFPQAKIHGEIAPALGRFRPLGPITAQTEGEWRSARDLFVRFSIEEGVRVHIGEIRFEAVDGGPLPRDQTFMRELLLSRVGDPLQLARIREDNQRLKRFLGDQGYPHASVEPAVSQQGDRATVVWQIKPGQQVRVGPVFVRGNFATREDTILLWVPLRTGSTLTTTEFERGQRNLALIQLFNNASPINFPAENANDAEVPMVIEVEERHDHWGVVRVGGGASTEQRPPTGQFPIGIYASAGYEHRNLFGRGWTFLSQGNYGNSLARAAASFIDPRFLGSLFRLELSASYLRQATVRLGDIRSGSGSIGFAREMAPGVDAALRYNLRDTFRTEFLLRGAGPDEEQQTVQIGTVVGSMSLTVDWLRIDNPLVPTRGFKISAGLETALPAFSLSNGEDTFVKLSGRALVVVPLLPWLSLRHSVRYDQGLPFGAPVLPKVERYFGGGDTTIRGFELDRARSEVIRFPLAPGVDSVQYRPVGGSLRILHNVDLQFPILRPWYGAVFLDSGIVADSLLRLEPARFRHGIGVAPLLIRLPIGDLSLSWAWPLDPQNGDALYGRLHFNVGLMF